MQLKARIKARAQRAQVSPQLMMQDYLLERLLVRLSRSPWKDRIVIKGGMLISSMIGVESRVTKDLDTTVCGVVLTHGSARDMFCDIMAVDVDDGLRYEFIRTEDIREADDYPGVRVCALVHYGPMRVALTIDVTTGIA